MSTWEDWGNNSYKYHEMNHQDILVTDDKIREIFKHNLVDFEIEPTSTRSSIVNDTVKKCNKIKAAHVAELHGPHLEASKRIIAMHYKVHKCNKLLKKDYDVVVRGRPDLIFMSPIHFSNYKIKKKQIYVPERYNHGYTNDQFAFGDQESMNLYASLYERIPSYFNEIAIGVAENLMRGHLTNHRTGLKILTTHIDYHIRRPII